MLLYAPLAGAAIVFGRAHVGPAEIACLYREKLYVVVPASPVRYAGIIDPVGLARWSLFRAGVTSVRYPMVRMTVLNSVKVSMG